MQIEQIAIYPIRLPFVAEFSHSLRKRTSAANVVVEIVADRGTVRGYGEAAPRSYVTGETQPGVAADLYRCALREDFPWNVSGPAEFWPFIDALLAEGRRFSAVCALETALLDALGKSQNLPVGAYFPSAFRTDRIGYGAAVPLADRQRTSEICRAIKTVLGIDRIKLKLGADLAANRQALGAVRDIFGDRCNLKVDVNCAWDLGQAMAHLDLIADHRIRAVEQPMAPGAKDIGRFAARLGQMGVWLMADESACSPADVGTLFSRGDYTMVNVRLSKCGGLRNSLRMIDALRSRKMAFQIGCHLGESGILSAAGRVLALLCRDAVYYDGSYDAYLLAENVTNEDVTFGYGGRAGPIEGAGLGVTVSRKNLRRLSDGRPPATVRRP